ncbi:MAG: Crp/Fnr family transcriptional regulator [Sphingomonas sp.]
MNVHALMIRKLNLRRKLGDSARDAIAATSLKVIDIEAGACLVLDGAPPAPHCCLLLDGLAIRYKMTGAHNRQIVAVETPGDFLDLQHLFLTIADHSVEALTPIQVAQIDRRTLRALALEHPAIGEALWTEALIEASITREWLANVGRRDGLARIAHLLCELALRAEAVGIAPDGTLILPLTQEQIGDITGMTAIHVNRMLKALVASGLIAQSGRQLRILDRPGLVRAGDFNPRYLHLDDADIVAKAANSN